ncbi:Csu type fimbrial protein [Telluria beijingensis]|uniref:Csu type fimbrial protein n=1 Tax=Telluria beijingensis TaxID=3068633 RepID=UPI002795E1B4|nr:spore coat U domain-containing protein [Massilia sp. REN29]
MMKTMTPLRWLLAALLLWLMAAPGARADNCVANMTDVDFGVISPLASTDYTARGTLTVTCYWTLGQSPLLLPAANVCVNLGTGSGGGTGDPRYMTSGARRLAFNLYGDPSYTSAWLWGGNTSTIGAKPIAGTLIGLLGLGGVTQSVTIYGRIPAASLVGVGTSGNVDTLYTASFAGHGTVQYSFGAGKACTAGVTEAFAFQARATVTNDCQISAGNLVFGSGSPLSERRASAPLSVTCTANSSYQISMNGGQSGNPAARAMKNSVTGETLGYRISSTPDGAIWGDGSGGTLVYTGTGTGVTQSVMMHGLVPRQRAPTPGNYRDTITVQLTF